MKTRTVKDYRRVNDLRDMLNQSAELYKNSNAFMIRKGEGEFEGVSYPDFKKNVDSFGTALIDLGLKDSFIAVLGENRYEWCVTYLSVVNGAGIIVPLDKELPLRLFDRV